MTDQARADFIRVLESAGTFLEAVERDFSLNKLQHPGKQISLQNSFQSILTHLDDAGDTGLSIGYRVRDLRGSLLTIGAAVREKVEKGILFSDRAHEEVIYLFQATSVILKTAVDYLGTENPILLRWLENRQRECKNTCDECATSHEERLVEGICVPAASMIFLDMLQGFAGIHWQVVNMMWLVTGSWETPMVKHGTR